MIAHVLWLWHSLTSMKESKGPSPSSKFLNATAKALLTQWDICKREKVNEKIIFPNYIRNNRTTSHLSFVCLASWLVAVLPSFTELLKVTDLLADVMIELGVFFGSGELNAPSFCELFALPFDSNQALNLASMSTITFGVSSLWAEGTTLVICLDRAAKLTVWTDSWYSPGFWSTKRATIKFWI